MLLLVGACTTTPNLVAAPDSASQADAFALLKDSLQFRDNPVVRAAAVEALEADGSAEARPHIRLALLDDHPGVRFAACMAVGTLQDRAAEQVVRQRLADPDASVRIAAIYALHQLGDSSQNVKLPTYLLDAPDPTVRRNAALVIGRIRTPTGVKVLAKAMKDRDPGVRHHALEAMARLGNSDARQELTFMTNSGVGSDEVFALNALAELREPICRDTFRYKLANGAHPEIKLAAARGLGLLQSDEGFAEAIRVFRTGFANRSDDPRDPPKEQRLRVYQLSAAALGAIGRPDAQRDLQRALNDERDPRVRVAIARAIVEIRRHSADDQPRYERP